MSNSIQPFMEAQDCGGENRQAQDGQGDILGPEDVHAYAFEENDPDDHEDIAKGIQEG